MSFWDRKITFPPSSRIPTSKLTRVRVDGLLKIIAQTWPARGRSGLDPRLFLNSRADSSSSRSWSAVCDSIERKWSIGKESGVRIQEPEYWHGMATPPARLRPGTAIVAVVSSSRQLKKGRSFIKSLRTRQFPQG